MPVWRLPGVSLPESGQAVRVNAGGTPVAVFRIGERLVATAARCTHVGGPLDRGPLTGNIVTCPLHGSQFDVTTGQVVRGPAVQPIQTYRARVEADTLVLETD
jgi:nitrite reductase/ring-hydroxylating ferredoxin subunit